MICQWCKNSKLKQCYTGSDYCGQSSTDLLVEDVYSESFSDYLSKLITETVDP